MVGAATALNARAGGKEEAPGLTQNPGLFYVDYRHLDGGQDNESLDDLPELTLKRTLPAAPGAHHLAFFTTESGLKLMVVQNNLLNTPGFYPIAQ